MKVFTNSNTLTMLVFFGLSFSYAQFRVMPTGSFFAKGNTLVYSNENTVNDGILSFETGKLIVDKDFTNNSPTSPTTILTPFFNMTRATLQVGGGGSASNAATLSLNFRDFPTWSPGSPSSSFANNTHTPIAGFDQILHLIVNKTSGNVNVTRGVLHLTSLDPLSTGDGLSTFSVLSPTTFNGNQRVTLRSSSIENTAVVGPSNNNAVVNNIVVERFIPRNASWDSPSTSTKGRAWRFLSPTTTGGTINSNWQEGASNAAHLPANDPSWGPTSVPTSGVNNNPVPGYGTHITGGAGLTTGTDSQPSQNASVFVFNNSTQSWSEMVNTTGTNMVAGDPYRILVRGNRSNNLNFNASVAENTILRTTGSLRFGTVNLSSTASTANSAFFFGNAYQSAVDLNAATKVNVKNNAVRAWDPNLGVTGSWTTIDLANAVATGGSGLNNLLQPGQAFVVEAQTAGPIQVIYDESLRITNQDLTQAFDNGPLNRIDLRLYTQSNFVNNRSALAGIFIDFNQNGNNNFDVVDIGHSNNIDETIASLTDDNIMSSMQNRNLPQNNEIVNLDISRYRGQNYTFRLFLDNFLGRDAFLKDNFTNDEVAIIPGEALIYNFNVNNQITASVATDRFDIIFRNSLNVDVPFGSNFSLYPNPNTIDKFYISTQGIIGENVNITVVNMLGQIVDKYQTIVPSNGILEAKSFHLAEGVYNVSLTTETDKKYSAKLIKNN